jgi:hypothetical protein
MAVYRVLYRVLSVLRASVPGRPCGFKCDDNRQDSGCLKPIGNRGDTPALMPGALMSFVCFGCKFDGRPPRVSG